MGSGSSAEKASAASQPPTCPLFYNHAPNPQLIPASALPTRDARGNVRRPQGGCAARIIALRHLPVVTPEAKKEAKDFFSNLSKMKKAKQGDAAGLTKLAELEEQARAIQQDPSLAPGVSSCFLVNIAVDEQGRLAPISTDGPAGLADTAAVTDITGEAEAAETGSAAPASGGRKGFNFEPVANASSVQPSPGGTPPPPTLNGNPNSRRPPPLTVSPSAGEATSASAGAANLGALPSSISGRQPPQPGEAAAPVQRISQQSGGTGAAAAPVPLMGARVMPTVFAPPISTISDTDSDGDGTDSNVHMGSSTRSLLIKDSRYRRGEGTEAATPPKTAAAVGALGAGGDPSATRLRRQYSRIRLMQVPNRTRWFLFNDSRSHEAHVTLFFCYTKSTGTEKGDEHAKDDRRDGGPVSPQKASKEHRLEPGALKMMCVPTPLARTSMSPKEVKKQLENSSSSSRSFVEWEPSSVSAFLDALPAPTADAQKELLTRFEACSSTMAAICLFVVLAPGVTVFLAEGEATAYMVNTHMVPFNPSTSMAVLGRLLTPDMVLDSRRKTAGLVKDCYRHKLIYMSPITDPQPASGPRTAANTTPSAAVAPMTLPAVLSEDRNTSAQARPNTSVMSATPAGGTGTLHPKPSHSNTNSDFHISSIKGAPPLPGQAAAAPLPPLPLLPSKLYRASEAATSEPLNAAGDAAAPSSQPQQRLSQRSPASSPTGVPAGTNGTNANRAAPRRKRIGSMLRNPSMGDNAAIDDEDSDESFHRDLPSTNSLAISF